MPARAHKQLFAGFTLVELMIAMTLGLLMGAAVLSLFVYNNASLDRNESVLRMEADARNAIRELVSDLSMAGYWADLVLPQSVTLDGSLAVGNDCGPLAIANWIYRPVDPGTGTPLSLVSVDNATAATAAASFQCLADVVEGTDIVAVKRLVGQLASVPLETDTVYLRTNGTVGLLFKEPAATPPAVVVPTPYLEWEYRPAIYYVRDHAVSAGDGIPTLCRKALQYADPPTVETECLAQGIENLQIEYGLDPDGDGAPDFFDADPTLAELATAVTAEIHVLVRSSESDRSYVNEKTYSLGNAPDFTPNDNFRRRVHSISVSLRNLRAFRLLRG